MKVRIYSAKPEVRNGRRTRTTLTFTAGPDAVVYVDQSSVKNKEDVSYELDFYPSEDDLEEALGKADTIQHALDSVNGLDEYYEIWDAEQYFAGGLDGLKREVERFSLDDVGSFVRFVNNEAPDNIILTGVRGLAMKLLMEP